MSKTALLLIFLLVPIASATLSITSNPIEHGIIELATTGETTGGGGGNSSWNETLGNLLYWRLDGTNAPPTAFWDMNTQGFYNLSYMSFINSNPTTSIDFFGVAAATSYIHYMNFLNMFVIGSDTQIVGNTQVEGNFSVQKDVEIGDNISMYGRKIIIQNGNGLQIGTVNTQRLGFLGATPVSQQAITVDLRQLLINFGFYPNAVGATPLNLGGTLPGATLTAYNGIFGATGTAPPAVDLRSTNPVLRFSDSTAGQHNISINVDVDNMTFEDDITSTPLLELNGGNNITYILSKGGAIVSTNLTVNRFTNLTQNVNIQGNLTVKRPFLSASDNTTQPIVATGTAYPVNFSTIEDNFQITITNKQNITVQTSGVYLLEFSAIVTSSSANSHVEIWFQKDNVNIARSNTKLHLPNANAETVLAVPFIVDMNTSDYLRIMWAGDNTGITMSYTTNTSYSPESPSIILTMTKIGELV